VQEYVPDRRYLYDVEGFDFDVAARLTAKCVAQWATSYECWPVGYPDEAKSGLIPGDPQARHALIGELWEWLVGWWAGRTEFEGLVMVGLYLDRGGQPLLDQHDGVNDAMRLLLSPEEFAQRQQCWSQLGLPVDLYEPSQRRAEL
jgi:hypothetical protein